MIEIFNAISRHMVKGIMLHEQMADYFDFLGLSGFKRWAEVQYIHENAKLRGLHRYAINHLNKIINDEKIESVELIPSSWYGVTRQQVDSSTRKQGLKEVLDRWYDWEKETKEFYERQFKTLTDNSKIAEANKINELICDVDHELKCVCRKMIEYRSVEYDMSYVMFQQQEMHDKYEKELKEVYKIEMC